MKYKIGDRLLDTFNKSIIEIIGYEGYYSERYKCIFIDPGDSGINVGTKINLYLTSYCTYLGNFRKADNFNELYNLMNE